MYIATSRLSGRASAHQHLTKSVAHGLKGHVHSDAQSLRELLGQSSDYGGEHTTVEAYDRSRVSLPDEQLRPVDIASLLPSDLKVCLDPKHIMVDDDVYQWRCKHEPVEPYEDETLRSNERERILFLKRLWSCGIIGFANKRRGRITPFFVKKK